jgi:hypothetical protein
VKDMVDAFEGGEDFGAEEAVGVGDDADAHGVRIAGLAEFGLLAELARVNYRCAKLVRAEEGAEEDISAGRVEQGLKPGVIIAAFSARLKPCPCYKTMH